MRFKVGDTIRYEDEDLNDTVTIAEVDEENGIYIFEDGSLDAEYLMDAFDSIVLVKEG
jgi:hypothetical protein